MQAKLSRERGNFLRALRSSHTREEKNLFFNSFVRFILFSFNARSSYLISAAMNTFDKQVKVQNLTDILYRTFRQKSSILHNQFTTKRRYKRGKKEEWKEEEGGGGKEDIEKTNVARSLASPELGFRCSRKLGLFI